MSLVASDARLEEFYPDTEPVATFWRQGTEGTYYWRLLIPARHLPARVNSLTHADTRRNCMERQDGPAIWQFLGDLERTKFAAAIQTRGVKSMMEVDDNYLVPAPTAPGIKSPWVVSIRDSFAIGASGYSNQAHRLLLPSIDGLIVSTDELANQYDGLVPAGIHVCPNSIDPADWAPVEHGHTDRKLVVGYSGSDSHFYDLALVERALGYAATRATLMKLGAHQNRWRWPHEQFPWTDDLASFRRALQGLDIGLCPLKRSRWHDSKSDIKAMEYVMAGAIPIVQADSPVYSEWAARTLSASTPKQWERAVKEAIGMTADERHALWKSLHDYVLGERTIDKHIHKWRAAL